MIDEKLLMEKLKESGLDDSEDRWLLRFVQEIIDKLPKVGEWIPCSEGLPTHNDFVLVTDKEHGVKIDFVSCFTNRFACHRNVIAWMELPKPYVKRPEVAAVEDAKWKEAMMRHFEKVE